MKHLMRQSVTVYPTSTVDDYNRETWTGGVSQKGRVELKTIVLKDEKGEEIQADAACFLATLVTGFSIGSRIDYDGESYRVLTLKSNVDSLGNIKLYKILMKRWKFA